MNAFTELGLSAATRQSKETIEKMEQDLVGTSEALKAGRIVGRVVLNFQTMQ
jgi:hypothetical protein